MTNSRKRRTDNQRYYNAKKPKILADRKAAYNEVPEPKKLASSDSYKKNAKRIKKAAKTRYQKDPQSKQQAARANYAVNADHKKQAARANYAVNAEHKKQAARVWSKTNYAVNAEHKKQAARVWSKGNYKVNAEPKKQAARAWSKANYKVNSKSKQLASCFNYWKDQKKQARKNRRYYAKHKRQLCVERKARYSLKEPKSSVKQLYVNQLRLQLLTHPDARDKVVEAYKTEYKGKKMPKIHAGAVCRVAASRIVSLAYQNHRKWVKQFTNYSTKASLVDMENKDDFGQCYHSASSEPYFYEASYEPVQRDAALPVDEHGQCVTGSKIEIADSREENSAADCRKRRKPDNTADADQSDADDVVVKKNEHRYQCWECSSECKPLTDEERSAIFSLREAFNKSVEELRQVVDTSDDGCPYEHYSKTDVSYEPDSKIYSYTCVPLLGHPLMCHLDAKCKSKVRMLRAASTHHEKLRKLQSAFSYVRKSHVMIDGIDRALCSGDYTALLVLLGMNFEGLFYTADNDTDEHEQVSDLRIMLDNSMVIESLCKEVEDDPDKVCCCCEQLHQRKSVTKVSLSHDLGQVIWPRLKAFIEQQRSESVDTQLFMCNYCKPMIKKEKMPGRCVLNGLETAPVPEELSKLSSLSP